MSAFSFFSSGQKRKPDHGSSQSASGMDQDSLCSLNNGGARLDEEHPEWPFPGWPRYRFEGFLGKGAMGEVYRVFDPVLNRSVALKVLGGRAMIHADRFMSEARAMARVDHPNVAKVFEVGTVEDRPYLTMQLLQGESLHGLRGKLCLEERVEMMRQACEGVQAAHRMGLLHRDIKPSNIVVEKDADGLWHAFVVDFGLACDTVVPEPAFEENTPPEKQAENALEEAAARIQAQGEVSGQEALTAASFADLGNVTGTPAFMSPEQAAGEALDRRSDVFSLGSTLYAILTGAAPFGGQSVLSILGNVALKRPAPLKDFEDKFPQDLEAIVLKAMEKDPLRRYPSARALSLDLERWLNGEAVEAVQRKPFYRLGRWIKKNRSLAGLCVLLILTVMGAVGLGWRASWRARAQARYYQYFCQEAERMEAKLALAEAMPLHDTAPQRKAILGQIRELERVMARAGSVAEAPGRYALGRGFLILEKWPEAREALETAWALGLQTPEVAAALGYCLSQLYAQGLEGLSGKVFRERKSALDATLKPLILTNLVMARRGLQGPEMVFVEAQLAKAGGRLEEASLKADQVLQQDPWHVRALMLKAQICLDQADGQLLGAASMKQAISFLGQAQEMAKSSAVIYEKLAYANQQEMKKAIYQRKPFMESFDKVLANAVRARQANSLSHQSWTLEADARWYLGDPSNSWFWAVTWHGEQYPVEMQRAIDCADRALALEPNAMQALNAKGIALWYLSEWQRRGGQAYQANLDKAIAAFEETLRQPNPTSNFYMNLGSCYAIRGLGKKDKSINPMPDFKKALEFYTLCEERKSDDLLFKNQSLLYFEISQFLSWQNLDTQESMRSSFDYARRILSGAQAFNGQCALARNYLFLAEQAIWLGKADPASLRLGTDLARQVWALQNNDLEAMRYMAKSLLLDAYAGGIQADVPLAKKLIRRLNSLLPAGAEVISFNARLSLMDYRKHPSWRSWLALERHFSQLLQQRASPELHLLAFEACRIGLEKRAPGATAEQWRQCMKDHIQAAKRMNPLIGPWADQLLKERSGLQN